MNDGYRYRMQIDASGAAMPLDRFLAARFAHSSIERWRERIDRGLVSVDGRVARPDATLRAGQDIVWARPPWQEPDVPTTFDVRYDDGDVLVVDKPAGLPTLPGGGFLQNTLVHRVRNRFPDTATMHRLGRWTSGLVLFARSRAARRSIARQFHACSIDKRYRALASGRPAADTFEVAEPIGPVPHALLGTVHGATPDGKPSRSRVTVVERRDRDFLCDVDIETGRPHQIRIHLAAAGYPLTGDPLYAIGGKPTPGCTALPGDPGYSLHAAEIAFDDPHTGKRIGVRS